eukprot:COSAG02_NODE_23315_length_722_cov_1.372392_1_plen_85_part_00
MLSCWELPRHLIARWEREATPEAQIVLLHLRRVVLNNKSCECLEVVVAKGAPTVRAHVNLPWRKLQGGAIHCHATTLINGAISH